LSVCVQKFLDSVRVLLLQVMYFYLLVATCYFNIYVLRYYLIFSADLVEPNGCVGFKWFNIRHSSSCWSTTISL